MATLAGASQVTITEGSERADRRERLISQAHKADETAQVGRATQTLAVRAGNADRVDLISVVIPLARCSEYQLEGSIPQSQIDVSPAREYKLTALRLDVFPACDRGVRDCRIDRNVCGKLC
jgi:hypothetical protein